ncbi:endoribonuclease YbeY-like [Paramacrobiotus metropolitanus]|uniref:endoribonuclease YbeY-like n=1 Tax=Paramacrobiotus metropolitanus TaxID=2943436 RepID=UPI002445680C|nr:endoribonuclease YbeY-like [Paramacrobiotus metropolitanus]
MSLLFRNIQTIVRFNVNKMRRDVELIRSLMKIRQFDISVSCVDNSTIRALNKRFRNTDEATDVLSFPFYNVSEPMDPSSEENMALARKEAAKEDPSIEAMANDLGDIYLGIPYIRDRCRRTGFPLEDELVVLTTHGFAHLLGYDHETSLEDFKKMYLFEFGILAQFDQVSGRNTRKVKEAIFDNRKT